MLEDGTYGTCSMYAVSEAQVGTSSGSRQAGTTPKRAHLQTLRKGAELCQGQA